MLQAKYKCCIHMYMEPNFKIVMIKAENLQKNTAA
jgi:hypothetical protein